MHTLEDANAHERGANDETPLGKFDAFVLENIREDNAEMFSKSCAGEYAEMFSKPYAGIMRKCSRNPMRG
jgi:hypothetical protein